jgi:hypothetical protein
MNLFYVLLVSYVILRNSTLQLKIAQLAPTASKELKKETFFNMDKESETSLTCAHKELTAEQG